MDTTSTMHGIITLWATLLTIITAALFVVMIFRNRLVKKSGNWDSVMKAVKFLWWSYLPGLVSISSAIFLGSFILDSETLVREQVIFLIPACLVLIAQILWNIRRFDKRVKADQPEFDWNKK